MNANDLHYLIDHPEAVRATDKNSLEQLAREHPYFPAAYFLIAKRARLHNETGFESKLNLAAAYAGDRVRLYEFMHEPLESFVPATVSMEQKAPEEIIETTPESRDQELEHLLQSIHERKQQILATNALNTEENKGQSVTEEKEVMRELNATGSEFSPLPLDLTETETEPVDAGIDAVELKMMQDIERQVTGQVVNDLNNDFLINNERSGAGELATLQELLDEEAEISFIEEQDPEVTSISVIEEEFVLRDLDQDLKLFEMESLANAESSILLEQEAIAGMELPPESEIEAIKTVAFEMVKQDSLLKADELQLVNAKGGGGAEYLPIEVQEFFDQPESLPLSGENESILELETASAEQTGVEVSHKEENFQEESASLRFSEHVPSPGVFLPGKSYSFLDWLQFFKPESEKNQGVKKEAEKRNPDPGAHQLNEERTAGIEDTTLFSDGLREEADTIDRIVASFRHETGEGTELLRSPADLARKSIEMDDDLVSETLATIYESQGLINKAIHMYARLSLKFPEKSLFFAARIKELKSKK